MSPKSIAIISLSTRATRVGPSVATFVHETLTTSLSTSPIPPTLHLLDLPTFSLPIFTGPLAPRTMTSPSEQHPSPSARAWSSAIASHDAYLFVSPEYNYGLPGAAKNALDYLWAEVQGKPAGVVTYGVMGGSKAGEQLAGTLGGMGFKVVEGRVELGFKDGMSHGPDVLAAVGEGRLGEATLAEWREGGKAEEVRGVGEGLVKLLEEDKVEKKEE